MKQIVPKDLFIPSTFRRIGAYFVDQFCVFLFLSPFWSDFYKAMTETEDYVLISVEAWIFLLLFPMVYQFLFIALLQQTPGKWVFNLWVVDSRNPQQPITGWQAFLRALTSRFVLLVSIAVYTVAFFRYDRTHFADWFAQTRVLQESPRAKLPQVRWIFGLLATLIFFFNGFESAERAIESVDWEDRQVDLQQYLGFDQIPEFDFSFASEDED